MALPVAAQYPSKPITFIAPAAAGGDADLSGRNLAQHAQKFLNNQPILVVNRPGASTAIGSMAVRIAAPDGYTLLIARTASHAILPAVDTKVPYKWNEFTMLSLLELNPYVCAVKSDSPIKSMRELVEQMRQSPGKLNFSTSGIGTIQNFGPQYLFILAGLTKDHAVGIHYKSGGEVTTSLLGGQVQFACNNLTTFLAHFKSGTLRALMVTTPQRLADLPDVPTSRELGWPDMDGPAGNGESGSRQVDRGARQSRVRPRLARRQRQDRRHPRDPLARRDGEIRARAARAVRTPRDVAKHSRMKRPQPSPRTMSDAPLASSRIPTARITASREITRKIRDAK